MSNHTTIVSYVKHWDNNTKGSISAAGNNLLQAIKLVELDLINEAIADGVDGDSDPAELFSITKAEVRESDATWTGVPKAAF